MTIRMIEENVSASESWSDIPFYFMADHSDTELINVTSTSTSSKTLGFGIADTEMARKILHYFFGTFLVLTGFAGIFGNGLVLYAFTKFQRLRKGGGIPLVLSLASGDLMVSILHFMSAYSSFHENWEFGDFGCQAYAALVGLGGLASLVTLSVISVNRCIVIMGRNEQMSWLSGKRACGTIWIFCLILTFPPLVGWSRYIPEGLGTSCSWDYETRTLSNRLFYIFLLILGFCVPVTAIIISYIKILCLLCRHSKAMNGITKNGVIQDSKQPSENDLKTAKIIFTIIVCFLVSWTPYAIVSLIGQFGPLNTLSPLTTSMPALFAKASVIYNPIIYGLTHPHFRAAVKSLKSGSGFSNLYPNMLGSGKKKHVIDSYITDNRQADLIKQTSASGPGNVINTRINPRNPKILSQTLSSSSSDTEIIIHKKDHWIVLRQHYTKAKEMILNRERRASDQIINFETVAEMERRKKPDIFCTYFCTSDNNLMKGHPIVEDETFKLLTSRARDRSIKSLVLLNSTCNDEHERLSGRIKSCSDLEKLRSQLNIENGNFHFKVTDQI